MVFLPPAKSPTPTAMAPAQAAAPYMRDAAKAEIAAGGRPAPRCILNVSSVSGMHGSSGQVRGADVNVSAPSSSETGMAASTAPSVRMHGLHGDSWLQSCPALHLACCRPSVLDSLRRVPMPSALHIQMFVPGWRAQLVSGTGARAMPLPRRPTTPPPSRAWWA